MGTPGIRKGLTELKALSSAEEYYIYARKTVVPQSQCLGLIHFFSLSQLRGRLR